jgi:hypothetical protein
MNMAVFVTNPSRRRRVRKAAPQINGAVNKLVAKQIGVDIRTQAGRDAVAAFKRTPAYKAWGGTSAKAITAERAAKKKRTAASKAYTKKTGKSRAAQFIESILGKKAGKKRGGKAGKGAAAKAAFLAGLTPSAPAGKAGKATGGVMLTSKGQPYVIKMVDGRKRAVFISKAAAASMGKKAPAAKGPAVKTTKRGKGKAGKKKNPYGFFGSRRKNGLSGGLDTAMSFAKSQLTLRNALYTAGTGAVVGIAHAYLAPMISNVISEYAPNIPVVGEYVARAGEAAPYTITGFLAGTVVAGIGAALNISPSLYGPAAVLALGSGIVMDTVSAYDQMGAGSDKAGIVYNGIAYNGIAYSGAGYGGLAAMTNPGYGSADAQAVMAEYGDAMESDAAMSGDDFDDEEGQAFMQGPRAFFARFGRPARVASRARSAYSRHAGKPGHRWAWLVKLVGFDKAAEIASLSPDRRLSVIAALKAQALRSLPALMAQQNTGTTTGSPYTVGMDAAGAQGASGSMGYGAIVYAGAGY